MRLWLYLYRVLGRRLRPTIFVAKLWLIWRCDLALSPGEAGGASTLIRDEGESNKVATVCKSALHQVARRSFYCETTFSTLLLLLF